MYCHHNEANYVFDSFLKAFWCLVCVRACAISVVFASLTPPIGSVCEIIIVFFTQRNCSHSLQNVKNCSRVEKKMNDWQLFFSFINFISHAFSCVYSELWDFFLLVIRAFEQRNLLFRCNDEFNTPAYPPLLNLVSFNTWSFVWLILSAWGTWCKFM